MAKYMVEKGGGITYPKSATSAVYPANVPSNLLRNSNFENLQKYAFVCTRILQEKEVGFAQPI